MPYQYPSSTGVMLPNWEKTSELVAFIRNHDSFAINDYVAFRPAKKVVGVYVKFDPKKGRRVGSIDRFRWPETADRPDGSWNQTRFDFPTYRTQRFDVPVRIPDRVADNAMWDMIMVESKMAMQQYMTLFTKQIVDALETQASWGANTDTAANLCGGQWDAATSTNNYIKETLDNARIAIMKATGLPIRASQLNLVLDPTAAQKVAQTAEVVDFVKNSRYAGPFQTGEAVDGKRGQFGLPARFHDYNIVIEDASIVASEDPIDDATAATFVKNGDNAFITYTPGVGAGDQVGDENEVTSNFSTFQVFHFNPPSGSEAEQSRGPGGLAVMEVFHDEYNRVTKCHIVWDTAEQMVAPETGYFIRDLFS